MRSNYFDMRKFLPPLLPEDICPQETLMQQSAQAVSELFRQTQELQTLVNNLIKIQ
ncbi:hypothetical protein FACS1894206_10130 [Deltaproteobacteria bacterium]|nr:hypothetical protein FACS1894206_10130 [Deltaproteobacteria bacterium]